MDPEFIVNGDLKMRGLSGIKKHIIFNWLKEKERLFRIVKNADIAVMDSYLAPLDIYRKISQLVKTPVYIDDNKRLKYPKGIIINCTICVERSKQFKNKDRVYLAGSQYIPLRKEFWDVPAKKIKKKISKVMITFGGDDSRDMTPKILKILNDNYKDCIKNVVVGKGFRNIGRTRKLGDRRTNFVYSPDAMVMKRLMLDSDIAISAGGQTLYEFARTGLPSIGICVADNQRRNVESWKRAGVVEYIGRYDDRDLPAKLLKGIKKISGHDERLKRGKIARRLVDGRGARRIVDALLKEDTA